MIHVYGTSHVSEDSLELIDQKIDEHDPEIVALELDMLRLEALLRGDRPSSGPVFLWLMKKFQDFVGSKTGVMPGDEMLHAFQRSMEENREVALIDQDIRITVDRLGDVSRKEKVKAAFSLLGGLFLGGSFDLSSIPGEDQVETVLDEFRDEYPGLYSVLVADRDQVMAEALEQLESENPDADIVAFVGAGHERKLQERLQS
ncbi:MAG: TraB domain-containing protein [Candidatus Nanohaloarchaea archaeon]